MSDEATHKLMRLLRRFLAGVINWIDEFYPAAKRTDVKI